MVGEGGGERGDGGEWGVGASVGDEEEEAEVDGAQGAVVAAGFLAVNACIHTVNTDKINYDIHT